jgi:hypothetical protein
MKICEVIWDDAWTSTDDITLKQAMKAKPVRTRTVGQVLCENDSGIIFVTDSYKNKKSGKIPNMIPWEMVIEYWEYEDV